jgi:protein-disulfide isomerase
LLPSEIPYRANVWALKALGVEKVISPSAVGSLREELPPRRLVAPSQIVDRTRHRPDTFFGDGLVAHVSLADPVCGSLAERLTDDGIASAELYDYATKWGYTAIVYEDERASLDEDRVYPVQIGDSPVRGPADAPITIIAFSDFQCPFCARGHQTMEQLRARYGDQIRFVFKHFPLPGHLMGARASQASFAAAEVGKFWEFHDAVFEFGGRFDDQDLADLTDALGVPRARLEAALSTQQYDPRIEADLALCTSLMVDGTPAYFINGRPIVGAHPLMDFRMLIAEELDRVAQARAQGVAPADIYEHLTKTQE